MVPGSLLSNYDQVNQITRISLIDGCRDSHQTSDLFRLTHSPLSWMLDGDGIIQKNTIVVLTRLPKMICRKIHRLGKLISHLLNDLGSHTVDLGFCFG